MLTILVPTDFSESARNAFRYALSLFGSEHHYILFNAYVEPSSNVTSMVSLRDILHESSVDGLNEERAEMLAAHPDLKITTETQYGNPAANIIRYTQINDADVVVMGTEGASGLKKFMLGSVASEVLHKAHAPVIVTPLNYKFVPPKNLLYTADLLDEEDVRLSDAFKELLDRYSSKITILTVNKPGKEIDENMAEKGFGLHMILENYQHDFDTVVSKDIESAIIDYAHDNDIHMLITTPRQHSWINQLFKPSVSKELAEHLDIPMMAMH
ncbi:MAG: universal stress protein [Salibacteraceae bacterium]